MRTYCAGLVCMRTYCAGFHAGVFAGGGGGGGVVRGLY